MSAAVENMFYVREVPWHGLGINLDTPPTSKDAIVAAGLDWTVDGKPIYDVNGNEISGYKANTRSSDNKVLGIVGNRYQVVNNSDAFDFTDSLVQEGLVYETAGSLCGGRKVWLLGRLPDTKILGEDIGNYICFMNTHDGTGSIKVCCTPIRVVCNNTLNFALSTAKRMWSTKHVGDVQSKLEEARTTLGFAKDYMTALDIECDRLANIKMSDTEFEGIFDEMYPVDINNDSERKITTINNIKTTLFNCLLANDLIPFKDTVYGKIQAVSDYVSHAEPARMTNTYFENNWGKIITGHPMLDNMYKRMVA